MSILGILAAKAAKGGAGVTKAAAYRAGQAYGFAGMHSTRARRAARVGVNFGQTIGGKRVRRLGGYSRILRDMDMAVDPYLRHPASLAAQSAGMFAGAEFIDKYAEGNFESEGAQLAAGIFSFGMRWKGAQTGLRATTRGIGKFAYNRSYNAQVGVPNKWTDFHQFGARKGMRKSTTVRGQGVRNSPTGGGGWYQQDMNVGGPTPDRMFMGGVGRAPRVVAPNTPKDGFWKSVADEFGGYKGDYIRGGRGNLQHARGSVDKFVAGLGPMSVGLKAAKMAAKGAAYLPKTPYYALHGTYEYAKAFGAGLGFGKAGRRAYQGVRLKTGHYRGPKSDPTSDFAREQARRAKGTTLVRYDEELAKRQKWMADNVDMTDAPGRVFMGGHVPDAPPKTKVEQFFDRVKAAAQERVQPYMDKAQPYVDRVKARMPKPPPKAPTGHPGYIPGDPGAIPTAQVKATDVFKGPGSYGGSWATAMEQVSTIKHPFAPMVYGGTALGVHSALNSREDGEGNYVARGRAPILAHTNKFFGHHQPDQAYDEGMYQDVLHGRPGQSVIRSQAVRRGQEAVTQSMLQARRV